MTCTTGWTTRDVFEYFITIENLYTELVGGRRKVMSDEIGNMTCSEAGYMTCSEAVIHSDILYRVGYESLQLSIYSTFVL